ncbi:hypothetical protein ACH3VR_12990 [Microbacterium sp. B2969]|uniref:MinD-like ATPase involved in chromosome partitioning or flagellar assembly n=1 Tax=Microbacterium alkaliflavum TaxID=3248839 RepID=A0ABW7Q996_9MICO
MTLDVRGLPSALFGSAVARHTALTEWDASIRGILPTARRIGFVSLDTGAGATTLAGQAVRILAARRTEPVLAIDVADGALAARLGAGQTPPSEVRAGARTTADAVTGLDAGDGWFTLRPPVPDGPVGAWLADAAPITRFFDVSVTDFGARHPLVDLAQCAALCDVVCLVSASGRAPAELARAVAPAIAALPEGPAPVLALVDRARDGDAVARAMAGDAWPVVGIPFDRGLRASAEPAGQATLRGLLRLVATLVSGRTAVPA